MDHSFQTLLRRSYDSVCAGKCIQVLNADPKAVSVTVFVPQKADAKHRIRVTRVSEGDLRVSIGKPNSVERKFLKLCRNAKTDPREYWISKRRK